MSGEQLPAGRIAVFDCFSGIAGDMTLAALLDAGAPLEDVRAGLARLALPAFEIEATRVQRGGLAALHVTVKVSAERTYQPEEMRALVRAAGLPARVEERARTAIGWLERGEALAHGTENPHLHEAGGVDAVVDIVGSMLALEALGIDAAWCPVVTVGAGTMTRSAHGAIPASPGPAAANILEQAGFPMRFVQAAHELVTPTGAAILAAVAAPGPVTLRAHAHGAGAGSFDPPGRPNALRLFVGEAAQEGISVAPAAAGGALATRRLALLEANIDDMTPALLANARDRLLEEGALDAWLEPLAMKKGRAANKLCALVAAGEEPRYAALFLGETTTLGVRTTPYLRYEAERCVESFASSLGEVRVKVARWPGGERRTPEFEDVKALAAQLGRPALEVQRQLERELG